MEQEQHDLPRWSRPVCPEPYSSVQLQLAQRAIDLSSSWYYHSLPENGPRCVKT